MNFSEKELKKIIAKDVFKDLIDCYKLITDPYLVIKINNRLEN